MRQTVFIRILSNPWQFADELEWVVRSRSGDFASVEQGTLELLKPFARQNQVVLMLPSAAVSIFNVDLLGVPSNRANKAIAYALEEQVADDIDELHFVISNKKNSNYRVAAVRKDTLKQVINLFAEEGITIDQVTAEQFSVPHIEGETSILLSGETALVALNNGELSMVDAANLQHFDAELNLNEANLFAFSDNPRTRQIQPLFDEDKVVVSTGSALPFVAELTSKDNTNFLQGVFAPVSQWVSTWKQWRFASLLALILLVLYVITKLLAINTLHTEAKSLDQEIETQFKRIMPGKRLVDPAIQIRREVEKLSQGNTNSQPSPLTLLEKIMPALQGSKSNVLKRIRFQQATLILEIAVANVADAEKIDQASNAIKGISSQYRASTNAQAVTVELKVKSTEGAS